MFAPLKHLLWSLFPSSISKTTVTIFKKQDDCSVRRSWNIKLINLRYTSRINSFKVPSFELQWVEPVFWQSLFAECFKSQVSFVWKKQRSSAFILTLTSGRDWTCWTFWCASSSEESVRNLMAVLTTGVNWALLVTSKHLISQTQRIPAPFIFCTQVMKTEDK